MIKFKSFTLPGCNVLIRASAITGVIEMPPGEGTQIVAGDAYHHVAHTLDQVMSAITKVKPIDTDDSLFGRVFGSVR